VTVDLVEFLNARISEDEEAARTASAHEGKWTVEYHTDDIYFLDHDWPDCVEVVEDLPFEPKPAAPGISQVVGYSTVIAERRSPIDHREHPDPEQRPQWPAGIDAPTAPVVAPEFNHIARWDPARVLAECQAKRRIVQQYQDLRANEDYYHEDMGGGALTLVLQHLAAPFAGHPDYPLERTR
jgi:hypothetical protein